ncbi:hypothetical protein [Acidaminobacter sp.]|uniref:hypothetical protein n=1 Tax=Acidaminobacter sp. TaxID=1872102 RepID=UPI00255F90A0|nr:hypothetical protein [Acidaminobacter sp.]MDK9709939.1 hypothetical protein [Acidaminobacter sp.]
MLFSRSRVVMFLICIFIFMAAIFVYTDQLIEDQIDRLEEDLLRLQASMVAWVAGEFQSSASVFDAEIQSARDRFIEQQFQVLVSLISNASTNAQADETLIAEFSDGSFGSLREDGSLFYKGPLPEAVISYAYSLHKGSWQLKKIERLEVSDPDPLFNSGENYVVYFYRSEKTGSVLFTGARILSSADQIRLSTSPLEAYLKNLHETRGYESILLNNSGRIVNAYDPAKIGMTLSQTDAKSGISLFQKIIDNPDQKFEVALDQVYEAYTLPLDEGHILLMKPAAAEESVNRFSRVLGYVLILFNLAIVTAVMMFLRKNHAFVIEKISLTEMQVKRRRHAAGFIVVVIVLGFAMMILLINGLLNIQMTQLDFDKELQRFSDAMAGQYTEAYESLEEQNDLFNLEMRSNKTEQVKALYTSLRDISSEAIRKYPSTASSSDYVINWMRVSQTTRELVASQYGIDLGLVEDYIVTGPKEAGSGVTLIGYDSEKLNVWVVQSLVSGSSEEQPFSWAPLAASGAHINGFFAHYTLKGLESIPVLEAVLPDSGNTRSHAEALGMALYHDALDETIGIRKPNGQSWIVYVPTSDPLSGDLRQAAYDFTRAMSLATLLLVLVVVGGWWHYGRKEPVS